jgi:hypothetical protein
VLYESERNWNDAYVDYQETIRLQPDFPGLPGDLWRMAFALRMPDETERWDKEYSLTAEDHKKAKELVSKGGGSEVIVLYENGISPIKQPNPHFRTLPKFYPRPNTVFYANVELDGEIRGHTALLHDIEATAIENLDEKYGGMVAKKLAGVVVKEVVADQVERRTKSPLLGFLSRVAMYAADQADLRSWNLLPRDLQIARLPVPPGPHRVRMVLVGGPALPEKTVTVPPGRKVFVDFRYMP